MSDRFYPDRPYVGVGAVIVDRGHVVLIKRKHEPLAGQWSLPGGAVELGESLEDCVRREMLEETGLDVEVGPVIEVFDRITRDDQGAVSYHFVLVDYLCWPLRGVLCAATDVALEVSPYCARPDGSTSTASSTSEPARSTPDSGQQR